MLRDASQRTRGNVFAIAAAVAVHGALFALLLKAKTFAYLVAFWPLCALALAWLAIRLWTDSRSVAVRLAVAAALVLIFSEGALRIAKGWELANEASPYEEYTRKVAACIPAGSLVLGLQHYWLGLREYPYRSWLVPAYLTHRPYSDEPLSMEAALEQVNPGVILVDRYMNEYFQRIAETGDPDHELYEGFQAFMSHRNAELRCTVEDNTYGTMRVYLLH